MSETSPSARQDATGTSSPEAAHTGGSPFDEPTDRFPVPPAAGIGEPGGGAVPGGPGAADGGLADGADAVTRRIPGASLVSPEDDVVGAEASGSPTQRIPTYEELSGSRREPEDIAAAMDRGLAAEPEEASAGRGTLDAGLFIVRVVLGAILFAHGLQKLTGKWGGPDLDGFRDSLAAGGFDHAHALSIAGPVCEVVAGALLVVGLLTPLAAAGAVALLINAWCFVQGGTDGLQFFTDQSGAHGSGVELETILLAAAAGLVLTGPGLVSADYKRGWTRRPRYVPIACLVVGVAAGVVVWVVLNGSNPFG